MPAVAADYDSDASAASTVTAATMTEDEPVGVVIHPGTTATVDEPEAPDEEPKISDDEPKIPDDEPTNVEVTLEITEPDADGQDDAPAGPAWADDRCDVSAAVEAMAALTTADTPADEHRPEDDAPTDPATRPGGKRKRHVLRAATKGDDDAPEPTA